MIHVAGVTGLVMPSAAEIEDKILKLLWTPVDVAKKSVDLTKLGPSRMPVLSPNQVLPTTSLKKCQNLVKPAFDMLILRIVFPTLTWLTI